MMEWSAGILISRCTALTWPMACTWGLAFTRRCNTMAVNFARAILTGVRYADLGWTAWDGDGMPSGI